MHLGLAGMRVLSGLGSLISTLAMLGERSLQRQGCVD